MPGIIHLHLVGSSGGAMRKISIEKWHALMAEKRDAGATTEELVADWIEASQQLPDPGPTSDLAHHQLNAAAHDLGIGEPTRAFWRHPSKLGKFEAAAKASEEVGVQFSEEYYKGCAIVCHVEGEPGTWSFRVHTVFPDFSQSREIQGQGFATSPDAHVAAMSSQFRAIDSRG